MLAAVMCSGAGTLAGIALLIWVPSDQGLAGWIFTASMGVSAVSWWQALRPPRRRSARPLRLVAAGAITSGAGLVTNLAISIWWPSHDGFGSAFLASALTVSLIFWWQASRRPRRQVQ